MYYFIFLNYRELIKIREIKSSRNKIFEHGNDVYNMKTWQDNHIFINAIFICFALYQFAIEMIKNSQKHS